MRASGRHIHGLPYARINESLSLGLTHGTAHLSDKVIQHIRERHPKDCVLCLTSLDSVISKPDFIGQEPHHPDSFEVVKQIGGAIVLVAISALPDESGDYAIQSSYIIPHDALQRRLRKGHLHSA